MTDTSVLDTLKASLIDKWNGGDRADEAEVVPEAKPPGAAFEAISFKRDRGGLAIGHSLSTQNAAPRIELRVTAASGPNFARARPLEQDVLGRGFWLSL